MARRYVGQMADGDGIEEVYLAAEKQLRANRNGQQYLQLDLRDRTGRIDARLWNAPDRLVESFEAGDFVRVKGKVQNFQGGLQIILSQLERVGPGEVEVGDFLPHTEQDVGKLYERLRNTLMKLGTPPLRALAECFLRDAEFVRNFCRAPAGVRHHHAYLGGLLEHVVTLLDAADRLAPLYPGVD